MVGKPLRLNNEGVPEEKDVEGVEVVHDPSGSELLSTNANSAINELDGVAVKVKENVSQLVNNEATEDWLDTEIEDNRTIRQWLIDATTIPV